MLVKRFRLTVLPWLVMACAGCETGTNHAMKKMDEARDAPKPHLTYMVDNAILHDMSISDMHFIPHTDELSSTGVARLDRMALLLDAYGGTVRYDTALSDQFMISQRIEHVREYLAATGCDMGRVEVRAMLSGGRGMPAAEALEILEKGTNPQTGTPGGGGLPAMQPRP
jgi:hypothetical protein